MVWLHHMNVFLIECIFNDIIKTNKFDDIQKLLLGKIYEDFCNDCKQLVIYYITKQVIKKYYYTSKTHGEMDQIKQVFINT